MYTNITSSLYNYISTITYMGLDFIRVYFFNIYLGNNHFFHRDQSKSFKILFNVRVIYISKIIYHSFEK